MSDSSHKSLKGHEAPVLCVALDPDEEFLVSIHLCNLMYESSMYFYCFFLIHLGISKL